MCIRDRFGAARRHDRDAMGLRDVPLPDGGDGRARGRRAAAPARRRTARGAAQRVRAAVAGGRRSAGQLEPRGRGRHLRADAPRAQAGTLLEAEHGAPEEEDSEGHDRAPREDDHRILGIQGVGTHISELVGEWTLALEMGALLEDIAGTIHAHPTMTEMTHEAVLATLGHAIHTA